ncbi:MAG: heme-binding protein [Bryobacterales bacterium]|nr:heme-binding protein [Bryobacterales bacterium]
MTSEERSQYRGQTMRIVTSLIASCLLLSGAALNAQLATKKSMTLEAARQIAAAAEAEAKKNKWNVVIAIVDDGANLVYLQKMDETQIGSIEVAQEKARTAVKFKRASKVFEEAVKGGRQVVLKLPGALPIEGGLPLMSDGKVIGAIGVSGVQSNEDGIIAAAGEAAFSRMAAR